MTNVFYTYDEKLHTVFNLMVSRLNFHIPNFMNYNANCVPKKIGNTYLCIAMKKKFTERELDRIIEMAWEDRTPFEAITFQFHISEKETIGIMRREMKPSSFKLWRKRVQGRATKHSKLSSKEVNRFRCSRQKNISNNKISKR